MLGGESLEYRKKVVVKLKLDIAFEPLSFTSFSRQNNLSNDFEKPTPCLYETTKLRFFKEHKCVDIQLTNSCSNSSAAKMKHISLAICAKTESSASKKVPKTRHTFVWYKSSLVYMIEIRSRIEQTCGAPQSNPLRMAIMLLILPH